MLTSIGIQNFKSFKDYQELQFAPLITLLIGENGSGKSSFVQSMALLKQNSQHDDLLDGKLTKVGGYEKLANQEGSSIDITVKGRISLQSLYFTYLKEIDYSLTLRYTKFGIRQKILRLRHNQLPEKERRKIKREGTESDYDFSITSPPLKRQVQRLSMFRHPGDRMDIPVTLSEHGIFPGIRVEEPFPPVYPRAAIEETIGKINKLLESDLTNLIFVPSFRGIYDFEYPLVEPQNNGNNESAVSNPDRDFLVAAAYNKNAEEKVSSLVSEILDRKFRVNLLPGPKVSAEIYNGHRWINVLNEGSGINPLVYLIYLVVNAPRESLVFVEEPEIYLHPSAQKRLTAVLQRLASEGKKRLIITTHSLSVILPFAQNLQDGQDRDSRILFFSRDKESMTSVIAEVTKKNANGILREFLTLSNNDIAEIFELSGRG